MNTEFDNQAVSAEHLYIDAFVLNELRCVYREFKQLPPDEFAARLQKRMTRAEGEWGSLTE
jgi:hypothetical protein